MRRLLSLVLALVMVLGVFSSAVVGAEVVNPREKLFNSLRTKFAPIRGENDADKIILIFAAMGIKSNNIFDSLTTKGIDADTIKDIFATLRDNSLVIKKMIKNTTLDYSEISSDLDKLLIDLYEVLPDPTKNSIRKYADTRDKKIDLITNIIKEFLDGKIGTGNYNLTTGKWVSFNLAILDDHIVRMNKIINGNETGDKPLTTIHKDLINGLVTGSINALDSDYKNDAGKLLHTIKLIEKVDINPPTPPGPGPEPGPTPTPTPTPVVPTPIIDLPKDTKASATATVGKDNVTITKNATGTTTIAAKEAETIKAVEALRTAAGKNRQSTLIVDLGDVKGLDFTLDLPAGLIEALVKNNVSLEIKTANSEIVIPVDILKGITIPLGARLELRVDEVSKTEATKIAPVTTNVKKVVDLSLRVIKGTEETTITNFKTYVTVKLDVKGLGNPDKLAVYYLNEETNELEFVTGKIENNMAILKLKHFSKYIISESKLTFTDLKDHWSKLYVESMAAKNVISGYGDETFRPNGEITRAEFAKMIVNALELDLVKYDGMFSDVKLSDWHAEYIATMVKLGFAGGYGDNTFKPNSKITRAEMAKMLSNGLDIEVKSTEKNILLNQFKDEAKIQDWAKDAIAKIVKAEIMVGDNGNFNPINTATRAQAATSIYRLYNK